MDQVKVTVKDTLKRSCEAIQIGEVAYMANEAKEITFEMPTEDVDIKVLTEDILYPFQVTDDTMTNHWDFEFYRCATTNGEYTKADKGACYQDYVRVYATAKEGITGKKVGTLQYTYDANVTWYSATVGEDADGRTYYQFYMAQGKSYSIRVSVENDAKPVAVKNTAHITAKYVKKVNGEWVENTEGFYAGDYIYAQITCEDGYKAGEVKTSYKYSSTSSYGGSTLMSVFDAENNVYRTNATITSTAYVDFAIEWTELSPRTVNFTADENVSFKFVKQDEKHDWVDATGTKYYKGDYCYVQATFLGNEDDFTWKGIEVKNGSISLTVKNQSSAEKIYSFIMPDADVNVTAQYKGAGAYKGYGFVGKYFGANLYNNSCANKAANSAYNITIDSAGEGAWGTSYFFDIVSLSEGSTKNNGFVEAADWRYNTNAPTRKSNKVLAYGTDFVAAYYSQFSNSAEISVDLNIAVKVQDESDTIGMYKFSGANKFDSNSASATNKGWAAYVAYRNNVVYKCMFIDKSTGYSKYYMSDVEFRFTTGSSVEDKTTAVYDVYAEGVKIGTVDKGTFTKA